MRIIDLYDLEHNNYKRERLIESLLEDIRAVASVKFRLDSTAKFKVVFKLIPVDDYI